MHIHTQTLVSSPIPFILCPFSLKKIPKFNVADLASHALKTNHGLRTKNRIVICSQSGLDKDAKRKRKVVEHVCLLKGKEDLSEEQEKDMLDYLYTTQYQMRGIVSISLGRVSGGNDDKYSHAIYMRFQTKEDLLKFYENQFYVGVLRDHVVPYSHVCPNMRLSMLTLSLK
ncbi:unnamed protein product [Withania somnifera]